VGVGKIVELFTKDGCLTPLRWSFVVTAIDKPNGFSIRSSGDFSGRGIWHLNRISKILKYCDLLTIWKIRGQKNHWLEKTHIFHSARFFS